MDALIGQSLGRYRIVRRLGEGGMAAVYEAFDTRLERKVALKVIRSELNRDEGFTKRFELEARALARLAHPGIVQIHDFGEQDGVSYLVMDYVPGGNLKQKLLAASGPLPYQESARILLPVAAALRYAHEKQVIHRDVKPANILLSETGEPMLTDFGLAKMLEANKGVTLTGSGLNFGTPDYMAPEQWLGNTTPQSDVYALGVVFYEMVTGRTPYMADTPAAVLLKQASDPLPNPSTFGQELPERVEQVLYKALAKAPEDRYPDMAAFASALEGLLVEPEPQNEPAATPPVRAPHRAAGAYMPTRPLQPGAAQRRGGPPARGFPYAWRNLALLAACTGLLVLLAFATPWQDLLGGRNASAQAAETPLSTDLGDEQAGVGQNGAADPGLVQTPVPYDHILMEELQNIDPGETLILSPETPAAAPPEYEQVFVENFNITGQNSAAAVERWRGTHLEGFDIRQEAGSLVVSLHPGSPRFFMTTRDQWVLPQANMLLAWLLSENFVTTGGGYMAASLHQPDRVGNWQALAGFTSLGEWVCAVFSGSDEPEYLLSGELGPGDWHAVQIWIDPQTAEIHFYLDGEQVASHIPAAPQAWLRGRYQAALSAGGQELETTLLARYDQVIIGRQIDPGGAD